MASSGLGGGLSCQHNGLSFEKLSLFGVDPKTGSFWPSLIVGLFFPSDWCSGGDGYREFKVTT